MSGGNKQATKPGPARADNHESIVRAKAILKKTGAEDVSSATESRVT
jgi:hypothetical protein